ncbi:hypothetical protein SCHPADRAFT_406404 [Schizopora paradoxa]|uniref:Uncharacterized protein n=1 Tax=Schizopora paradoxa TaxID=27342 RepID=A0A0H2RL13_9AGAM|nr:hypothetical protein SCHPADRAFT_406404 [Schizopora paradoxa]
MVHRSETRVHCEKGTLQLPTSNEVRKPYSCQSLTHSSSLKSSTRTLSSSNRTSYLTEVRLTMPQINLTPNSKSENASSSVYQQEFAKSAHGRVSLVGDPSVFNAAESQSCATIVDITPSPQSQPEDPTVIRRLKRHIQELVRGIGKSKLAFDKVEDIVREMDLKDEQRDELLAKWQDIRNEFEMESRNSNAVAIQARLVIEDFLGIPIKYLENTLTPVCDKLETLAHYRETLMNGKKIASLTIVSFRGIGLKMNNFKTKCTTHAIKTVKEMESALRDVEKQINEILSSFHDIVSH